MADRDPGDGLRRRGLGLPEHVSKTEFTLVELPQNVRVTYPVDRAGP